ncbi:hypothetical protein HGRIS_007750 [Hohenbuehelia grisea]|uniref:Uncharacterized protein n=1 Tax=Hohenbuehelia grisea TaxID=104357 RepID=A0ABR3J673_9AGAR
MNPTSEDRLVDVLPIHFSNALSPNISIHQFPLLARPLQVPPSAATAKKNISARIKESTRRIEIHIPADTRPEVWNEERGKELGEAQLIDDREKNQGRQVQENNDPPKLEEVRLSSEQIPQCGAHMLGVVRDGRLYLHPISETHQLRPTLTYLDIMSRKSKRGRHGEDSDSDDGPPPDPDEAPPVPAPKKEKKPAGEAKQVQVTARKSDDKSGPQPQGSLSVVRREMLALIRAEEDERWDDLVFHDALAEESVAAFESLISQNTDDLTCTTDAASFVKDIEGL